MLLIFKSILIVLFLVSNVQGQKANEEVNQYHPTISPDDIEMTIETDKRSYFPNEPIVLAITLRNKTGRQLDFMHDANRLHTCEITVLDPYREEKHIEFGKDKANDPYNENDGKVIALSSDRTYGRHCHDTAVTGDIKNDRQGGVLRKRGKDEYSKDNLLYIVP